MTTATKPPTTAVADYKKPTNAAGLERLAKPIMGQIMAAFPKTIAGNADRMVRCLLTECSKSPGLLECSPLSLFGGVVQVAQLGLELGGPLGQAYLIPFKGQASLVIGYKGFIALAHRSKRIKALAPRINREGDTFALEFGSSPRIVHKPEMSFTGKPVGYYAHVELDNGGTDFEYMTFAQMEEHKRRFALSQKGPWSNHFDEMALKTVVRRLAKRLPSSSELAAAVGLDESAEVGQSQMLDMQISIGGNDDHADDLRQRLEEAKQPRQYHDDEPPLEDGNLYDDKGQGAPPR